MGDQSPQKPPTIAQKRNRQCDEVVPTSQSIEIASDDVEIDFIAKKPRDANCVTPNGDGVDIATNGDDVRLNGDDETRQSNEFDDDYDDEDDDYDDLVSSKHMVQSILAGLGDPQYRSAERETDTLFDLRVALRVATLSVVFP